MDETKEGGAINTNNYGLKPEGKASGAYHSCDPGWPRIHRIASIILVLPCLREITGYC